MKNKRSIILLALALAANGAAAAGWFYLYSVIANQKRAVNEARSDLALIEKKASDSRSLKTFMDGIKKETEKIDAVFLNEEMLVNFIEDVEDISRKTGVFLEINSIKTGKKGDLGANFIFKLSGGFGEIFRFLGLLENMPYQIIIKKAHLRSEGKSSDWAADVSVILTSFEYNESF